jgi:hypothetical protein
VRSGRDIAQRLQDHALRDTACFTGQYLGSLVCDVDEGRVGFFGVRHGLALVPKAPAHFEHADPVAFFAQAQGRNTAAKPGPDDQPITVEAVERSAFQVIVHAL